MIGKNLNHKYLLTLVTCVTSLCVLFMGMRVPDISRPHRPKPTHRAFIEKQVKSCQQQAVKKFSEVHAVPAIAVVPRPAVLRRPVYQSGFQATGCPPLFPNSTRAPPVLS